MSAVANLIEAMRQWRPFAGAPGELPPPELVDEAAEAMEQAPRLSREVIQALNACLVIERAGNGERKPRIVLMVAGRPIGPDEDVGEALGRRFSELKTEPQRKGAATYLQEVLRARRRAQRRERPTWVNSW